MSVGKKILIAGILGLTVIWSGLWFVARQSVLAMLDKNALAAEAGRLGAACGERVIAGFPLSFSLACAKTTVVSPAGVRAEIAGLLARAPLYRPGRVETSLSSPASLSVAKLGLAAQMRFTDAAGSADLWLGGARRMSGTLEHLDLALSDSSAFPFKSMTLGYAAAEIAASKGNADSLDVRVDLNDLELVRPSGSVLPRLAISGSATVLEGGAMLRADGAGQFADWLAAGGRLHLNSVQVSVGESSAEALGDLALLPTGLLSGKLKLRLRGLNALPDLFEQIMPGSRAQAIQAAQVLTAFTRPVQTERGAVQEVDILLLNGTLMVGIVPVIKLPPLF